jgi:hypothetical protein
VDAQQHDDVPGEEVVLDAPHDSSERSTATPMRRCRDDDALRRGGRGQQGEEVVRLGGLDGRHCLRRGHAPSTL